MTTVKQAASTDAMRAQADQMRAGVREDHRALVERDRRAAQLAYEADLIDAAAGAARVLQGARTRLPKLEETVGAAVAAERAAEDRQRADQRHLSRRRTEQQKAEDAYLAVEIQEQAADRVRTAERVVAAGTGAVAKARRERRTPGCARLVGGRGRRARPRRYGELPGGGGSRAGP